MVADRHRHRAAAFPQRGLLRLHLLPMAAGPGSSHPGLAPGHRGAAGATTGAVHARGDHRVDVRPAAARAAMAAARDPALSGQRAQRAQPAERPAPALRLASFVSAHGRGRAGREEAAAAALDQAGGGAGGDAARADPWSGHGTLSPSTPQPSKPLFEAQQRLPAGDGDLDDPARRTGECGRGAGSVARQPSHDQRLPRQARRQLLCGDRPRSVCGPNDKQDQAPAGRRCARDQRPAGALR